MKTCFLDMGRDCHSGCMAYEEDGKYSRCKLLNATERALRLMSSSQGKPVAPAPKVRP